MNLREVGCAPGDWKVLVEGRDQWLAYVISLLHSDSSYDHSTGT